MSVLVPDHCLSIYFSYHFEFKEEYIHCISLELLSISHLRSFAKKIITLLSFQCMFKKCLRIFFNGLYTHVLKRG